jgi:hypothetical protein
MVNVMNKNYCMVNSVTNVCDNICLWDGNPQTWTPPANYLMLVQETTPSKLWALNKDSNTYELTVLGGYGGIGFTWDGTYLTTNQPQPQPPMT